MRVPASRGDRPHTLCEGDDDGEVAVSEDSLTSCKLSSSAVEAAAAAGSSQVAMPTTPMIVMIKNTMAPAQFAGREVR